MGVSMNIRSFCLSFFVASLSMVSNGMETSLNAINKQPEFQEVAVTITPVPQEEIIIRQNQTPLHRLVHLLKTMDDGCKKRPWLCIILAMFITAQLPKLYQL